MLKLLTTLLLFISFGSLRSDFDEYRLLREANSRHETGDLTGAAEGYRNLLDRFPKGLQKGQTLFNLGTTEYGLKHFRQASALFTTIPPGNRKLDAMKAYNRGNALAMAAFEQPQSPAFSGLLGQALASYRTVLLDDPSNSDARINYEIVYRALHSGSPPRSAPKSPAPTAPAQSASSRQPAETAIGNLLLESASEEEARAIRRYFSSPKIPERAREEKEW